MEDVLVISQQSTPPAQVPTPVLADRLDAWQTALLAAGIDCRLFENEITVSADTTAADFVECTSPGYARADITALDGPFLDADGNAYAASDKLVFTTTGGGDSLCYGAYVAETTGAAATVTFTLTGGAYTLPVITGAGSGYLVAPKITVTGATGTGAVLHTEITNGEVTAVVIDSPGTGYTTATATIEPPWKLVYAGNFPSPLPLNNATDSIQLVVQFDQLAAAG